MLDKPLKAVEPDVSLHVSVCLLNRNANDVHQCFHESLVNSRLTVCCLLLLSWLGVGLALASHSVDQSEPGWLEYSIRAGRCLLDWDWRWYILLIHKRLNIIGIVNAIFVLEQWDDVLLYFNWVLSKELIRGASFCLSTFSSCRCRVSEQGVWEKWVDLSEQSLDELPLSPQRLVRSRSILIRQKVSLDPSEHRLININWVLHCFWVWRFNCLLVWRQYQLFDLHRNVDEVTNCRVGKQESTLSWVITERVD